MNDASKTLIDLETRFWQSMVNKDAETAVAMLAEPALMVSAHGAASFDHDGYRKMAATDEWELNGFEFDDMKVAFPNPATGIVTYRVKQKVTPKGQKVATQEMIDSSTWVREGAGWRCVMHTETPAETNPARKH